MSTTTERTVPSAPLAEQSFLGAMLVRPEYIGEAERLVLPEDFYLPALGNVWAQMVALHRSGTTADAVLVAESMPDELLSQAGGVAALLEMQAATPSSSRWASYVEQIVTAAGKRRLLGIASATTEAIYNGADLGEVQDLMITQARSVDSGTLGTASARSIDQIIGAEFEAYDWLIPDLLERGERFIVVAGEGVGKSEFLRQMATAIAVGQNPFIYDGTGDPIQPARALIVDLENSERQTSRRMRRLYDKALTYPNFHPDNLKIAIRDSGIDLLKRSDRLWLTTEIEAFRPAFVAIGPLYKMWSPTGGKDSSGGETDAKNVAEILDDLRARYGFALGIEHHAAKGEQRTNPFGSSVWMRWPEFGFTIAESKDRKERAARIYDFGRFRGDRDDNRRWPRQIRRSAAPGEQSMDWPWSRVVKM